MSPSDSTERIVPVVESYGRWAKTYDTAENFLQKVDDELVAAVLGSLSASLPMKRIVDLGCGTGRNTEKLLSVKGVETVVGLDLTAQMLEAAQWRDAVAKGVQDGRLVLDVWDVKGHMPVPDCLLGEGRADGVICTLVLEHLSSLDEFFHRTRQLLQPRPGSWVFITNMHPDLGQTGGANFIDEDGKLTWTEKHVWSAQDVVDAAGREGLEAITGVGDDGTGVWTRTVRDEEHVSKIGAGSAKWIGKNVLFGVVLRTL
ncbi:Methyltransf-25 domain-containing protein [Mycena indigotica]|uniref:Methyltransf-25 domain-containing protein n=1 Tax=Mycena indigotica TaxID=2126181 RepID=A0A8H6TFQ7_9AGAR|nr:Methyltransf-25 domain-containing protein [Mycena indigotica]KAF7314920.1 Methyltransf-25 domain-containing protein [Mycena indigotica]